MQHSKFSEPAPLGEVERVAFRVPEAAALLGISRGAVYQLVKSGLLGVVRLSGGSARIPKAEIDRWVSENLERGKTK
jgi:excisionase family DNA binding protein